MKHRTRSLTQGIVTVAVISICIIYYLYINDYIDFRVLSIGDMNPYGGWSALKSYATDLSYRWRGFSKSISLTIAIAVTALFMGRFFCGFICPIGSMQDFFKYLGSKFCIKEVKLKNIKGFNLEYIKYFILISVLVFSILDLGNLISPLSPWLAYLNLFAGLKLQWGTLFLIFIVVGSLFIRRIFCRVLCPLGAFQSLLYAIGPLKIYKGEACSACSNCLNECPVNIDYNDEIVSPECINCLECINSSCIKNSRGYKIKFLKKEIKHYYYISIFVFLAIYISLIQFSSAKQTHLMSNIGNYNDGVYNGAAIGFGGLIQIEVSISDNNIKDIKIINHNETAGYYEEVSKALSKQIIITQNLSVDAISGATASSRGFINAIKDAVSKSIIN